MVRLSIAVWPCDGPGQMSPNESLRHLITSGCTLLLEFQA
jgi:hypothetical protein